MTSAPEAAPLTVRSAVPGRIRWQIDPLLRNPALADELEQLLGGDERLDDVVINADTGRLLVVYDPTLEPTGLAAELAARLLLTVEAHVATRPRRKRAQDRTPKEQFKAAWPELKTVLIGTPIAAVALLSANPLLVLTTIGAIAAAGAVFVKSLQDEKSKSTALTVLRDPNAGATARMLGEELKAHRTPLLMAAGATLASLAIGSTRFTMLAKAVDTVVPPGANSLDDIDIKGNAPKIVKLGGGILLSTVVTSALNILSSRLLRRVALDIEDRLRVRLYGAIQGAEMQYLESANPGELNAMVTNELGHIQALLNVAHDSLQILATVGLVAINFLFISPETAWIAMLGIPVTLLAVAWLQKRQLPRYRELRAEVARLHGALTTDAQALATMKSFNTEERQLQMVEKRSMEFQKTATQAHRLSAAAAPVVEMAVMSGIAGTVIAGGLLTDSNITAGQYSSMIMMSRQLLFPLAGLGKLMDTFQRSWVGLQRLFAIADAIPAENRGSLPLPREKVKGNIRYRDVHFSYNGHEVLHGVSMNIKAGKTTAIVGPTGSGKSTSLRLLIAFIRARSGSIEIEKQPLEQTLVQDLRRAFAFVSQDVYLFNGTIRENINLARPEATQAETERAARIAAADDFIARLPLGYDSMVGERGVRLSGGERQRIAIARAILSDAPILVFDEATSQLDNETEHRVYENINRELKKRTKIIVAHRLAAASMADWIYVLEDGRLCEEGKHDTLVERGGLYATLWRLQSEEQTFD